MVQYYNICTDSDHLPTQTWSRCRPPDRYWNNKTVEILEQRVFSRVATLDHCEKFQKRKSKPLWISLKPGFRKSLLDFWKMIKMKFRCEKTNILRVSVITFDPASYLKEVVTWRIWMQFHFWSNRILRNYWSRDSICSKNISDSF